MARSALFLARGGLGLPTWTELSGAHTGLGLSRDPAAAGRPCCRPGRRGPGPGESGPSGCRLVTELPQAALRRGPSPCLPAHRESSSPAGHLPVRAASERGLQQEAPGGRGLSPSRLTTGSWGPVSTPSHPEKMGALSPRCLTLGSWGALSPRHLTLGRWGPCLHAVSPWEVGGPYLHASSPGLALSPSPLRAVAGRFQLPEPPLAVTEELNKHQGLPFGSMARNWRLGRTSESTRTEEKGKKTVPDS